MPISSQTPNKKRVVPFLEKFGYGIGHVYNDMVTVFILSFVAVYVKVGLKLGTSFAGIILFVILITDALARPLIIVLSRKVNLLCYLGKRKSWHLVGHFDKARSILSNAHGSESSLLLSLCVFLIFSTYFVPDKNEWTRFVCYAPLFILLAISFTSVQVSHKAILRSMTGMLSEQVAISIWRSISSLIANIAVFVVAAIFLTIYGNTEYPHFTTNKNDHVIFQNLSYFIMATGTVCCVAFYILVPENHRKLNCNPKASLPCINTKKQQGKQNRDGLQKNTLPSISRNNINNSTLKSKTQVLISVKQLTNVKVGPSEINKTSTLPVSKNEKRNSVSAAYPSDDKKAKTISSSEVSSSNFPSANSVQSSSKAPDLKSNVQTVINMNTIKSSNTSQVKATATSKVIKVDESKSKQVINVSKTTGPVKFNDKEVVKIQSSSKTGSTNESAVKKSITTTKDPKQLKDSVKLAVNVSKITNSKQKSDLEKEKKKVSLDVPIKPSGNKKQNNDNGTNRRKSVGKNLAKGVSKNGDKKMCSCCHKNNFKKFKIRLKSLVCCKCCNCNWFAGMCKKPKFYKTAVIHACSRLALVVTQVFIPLYLTETLEMDKISIAIIPLVIYVTGFLTSLLVQRIIKKYGRKKTFAIGEACTVAACIWMFFITPTTFHQIYPAVILLGMGLCTLQIRSVSMMTDLTGSPVESGAAVFGINEKVIQAVAILLIQLLSPCGKGTAEECTEYYRNIMLSLPGGSTFLAFAILSLAKMFGLEAEDDRDVLPEADSTEATGLVA